MYLGQQTAKSNNTTLDLTEPPEEYN